MKSFALIMITMTTFLLSVSRAWVFQKFPNNFYIESMLIDAPAILFFYFPKIYLVILNQFLLIYCLIKKSMRIVLSGLQGTNFHTFHGTTTLLNANSPPSSNEDAPLRSLKLVVALELR